MMDRRTSLATGFSRWIVFFCLCDRRGLAFVPHRRTSGFRRVRALRWLPACLRSGGAPPESPGGFATEPPAAAPRPGPALRVAAYRRLFAPARGRAALPSAARCESLICSSCANALRFRERFFPRYGFSSRARTRLRGAAFSSFTLPAASLARPPQRGAVGSVLSSTSSRAPARYAGLLRSLPRRGPHRLRKALIGNFRRTSCTALLWRRCRISSAPDFQIFPDRTIFIFFFYDIGICRYGRPASALSELPPHALGDAADVSPG